MSSSPGSKSKAGLPSILEGKEVKSKCGAVVREAATGKVWSVDANIYGPSSVAVPGFPGGVGTMWER